MTKTKEYTAACITQYGVARVDGDEAANSNVSLKIQETAIAPAAPT